MKTADSFKCLITNNVLPIALQCGINILDFWDLTLLEVQQFITAYQEREKNELKKMAQFIYVNSSLNCSAIASALDKRNKFPTLYDTFPELFKEEKAKEDADRASKDMWLDFVKKHNKEV